MEEREEGRKAAFEEKRDEILGALLDEDPGALSRRYRVYVESLRSGRDDIHVNAEALLHDFLDPNDS